MAQCQVEGAEGEMAFEQILPSEDLLAIYRRITEGEIKVWCSSTLGCGCQEGVSVVWLVSRLLHC
jgi:hypothetical protein